MHLILINVLLQYFFLLYINLCFPKTQEDEIREFICDVKMMFHVDSCDFHVVL